MHKNFFDPTKREKQYQDLLAKRRIDDEKKYNETKDDISLLMPMKEEYHKTGIERNILRRKWAQK